MAETQWHLSFVPECPRELDHDAVLLCLVNILFLHVHGLGFFLEKSFLYDLLCIFCLYIYTHEGFDAMRSSEDTKSSRRLGDSPPIALASDYEIFLVCNNGDQRQLSILAISLL